MLRCWTLICWKSTWIELLFVFKIKSQFLMTFHTFFSKTEKYFWSLQKIFSVFEKKVWKVIKNWDENYLHFYVSTELQLKRLSLKTISVQTFVSNKVHVSLSSDIFHLPHHKLIGSLFFVHCTIVCLSVFVFLWEYSIASTLSFSWLLAGVVNTDLLLSCLTFF